MKNQRIVIALLCLILAVNIIGIGVVIREEKTQTEIAVYTAVIAYAGVETAAAPWANKTSIPRAIGAPTSEAFAARETLHWTYPDLFDREGVWKYTETNE